MKISWLVFLFFPVFILSCNGYKVISFNNPELQNQEYNTFRIITTAPDSLVTNEKIIFDRLNQAVLFQMKQKGFQLSDGQSDLLLRYKFFSSRRSDLLVNRNRSVFDPRFTTFSARNITESILLIDLHDRRKEKLVWQGSVDLDTPSYRNKKINEVIDTIVADIFDTFQHSNNDN